MDSIHEIVRKAEQNYINGTTKKSKYVDFSIYEIIQRIDAYINSKFMDGDKDALGRDKPFFNVVVAAANIWYRATDLDRKNAKFKPRNRKQVVGAFIASILLQDWMDKVNFGKFLNSWGRTLSKYGSAIPKFVESNGELIPSVVDWNRFIPDSIDFTSIPRIEKLYKTPAQLRNMATPGHPDYAGYNEEAVKSLIESAEQARKTLEGISQDTASEFLEIYEVHGELSTSIYKKAKGEEVKDGDEKTFFQQMHVVSFVKTESGRDTKYEDFTLYCGKEKQDPYMITHLIEEEGRVLSIGAVESLFDAQWMRNHTMKQWKDQMDLASRLIFQTADKTYAGKNVLTAIETGDINIHDDGKPLTQVNNQGHDTSSMQAFAGEWKGLEREITSTPDAVRGQTLPSGTPYRLAAILQQEGSSLFELMTENKGLYLEQILKKFVIPHLKKKIKGNKDEILAILKDEGIKEIDALYIPREAIKRYNKRTADKVLNLTSEEVERGNVPQPFVQEAEEEAVRGELSPLGNKRFFTPDELDQKTWDEIVDDEVWDNLVIEITDENKDKRAVLETLSSMLQTFAQADPAFAKLIRDKIAIETGVISPLEVSSLPVPTNSPPVGGGAALPANPAQ